MSSKHSNSYPCENAIDGDDNTFWATSNQGIGAWIKINFKRAYWIEKLEIKHRSQSGNTIERFKEITIEYSNGHTVSHVLNNDALIWNEIFLSNSPSTKFVKIRAESIYGGAHPGFAEVKVTGCPKSK